MSTSSPLLTTTTRFERKYRCSYPQYYALTNALRPYLSRDMYTQGSETSRYLVRSLYYESSDYQIYFEKVGGNANRAKFRIRTYGVSRKESPDIRVEIKIRRGNLTQKFGSIIHLEDYQHFSQFRLWNNSDDPVLEEFARMVHLNNLQPKVLVQYRREGFYTRDAEDIRITFDHDMQTSSTSHLFPENNFWHKHLEPKVVLEIKHQSQLPAWLTRIIQAHGLKTVANSKFALGVSASCKDLIHPGWSHG